MAILRISAGRPGCRRARDAACGDVDMHPPTGVAVGVAVIAGLALAVLDVAPAARAQPRTETTPLRQTPNAQAPAPLRPVVVQAGAVGGVPALGASSPYFRAPAPGTVSLSKPATYTLVEADYWNNATRYFGPTTENKGPRLSASTRSRW